ncbi:MAG: transglutaminase domain-containing protein [Paludibacteraceae bacterium]
MKTQLLLGLLCLHLTLSAATVKDSILALVPGSDEVFRYGYNELSPADQAKYEAILTAILQFDANKAGGIDHRVDIPWSSDMNALTAMLRRMQTDVPQLWVLFNYIPRYNYDTYTYQARISTVNTPESFLHDLLTIDTVFRKITAPITPDMSAYHKVKVLHDGFIAEVSYGNPSGANAGNIKGALIEKRAVCEGFSRAFLYLCQGVGIRCVYVSGSNTNGRHAWNHVEVDGKWYVVDLTADGAFAGHCGYDGFLRGQTYFDEHYTITADDVPYNNLPTLSATDCPEPTQQPTSVETCSEVPMINVTRPMFNVVGQRVGANYRGIVIQNGRKYVLNR